MNLHSIESEAKYKIVIRRVSQADEIIFISDLNQLDGLNLGILNLEVTTIMSTEKSLRVVAKGQKERTKKNLRKFALLREKKVDYTI